jgi:hypothetical protein
MSLSFISVNSLLGWIPPMYPPRPLAAGIPMILAITSIAGPEARKAEYPTSRLRTGNPQDEYRNDLILVLVHVVIEDEHLLHETFTDHCPVGYRYRAFGREESVPSSANLSVLLRGHISKKDVCRHERWPSAGPSCSQPGRGAYQSNKPLQL